MIFLSTYVIEPHVINDHITETFLKQNMICHTISAKQKKRQHEIQILFHVQAFCGKEVSIFCFSYIAAIIVIILNTGAELHILMHLHF